MIVRRLIRRSLEGVVSRVPGSAVLRAAAAWRYAPHGPSRDEGARAPESDVVLAREASGDLDPGAPGVGSAAGSTAVTVTATAGAPSSAGTATAAAPSSAGSTAAGATAVPSSAGTTPAPALAEVASARVAAAHAVAYDWDYAKKRPELRNLYEKSKDLNWNARTDLAWSTSVDPQAELTSDTFIPIYGTDVWKKLDKKRDVPRLRQHMASYMLSNFLHGEQGALLATAQIVECAPTTDAKLYAAAQVFDEARHVEAYHRYLTEKVELVYPPNVHLKQLLDTVLSDSRWDFKLLGMQILIEGLALGAFGLIHQTTQEPLIKSLTQMVMQDEARHVAFGVMSLRGLYGDMNEKDLREREDFVIESSRLLRDRFLAQEVWSALGLPQKECEDAANDSVMMQIFRKLLFSKIVPNVKRLGLLTPRVRRGFEELDVIEYESWEPSA